MLKKIVVFSGAGLDEASGIKTFRDLKDGYWREFKIDKVATPKAWSENKHNVINFYNLRRKELGSSQPNEAHHILKELENDFKVTHVTQNVSDLLKRVDVSEVFHLHGELTKLRPVICDNEFSPDLIDIGYEEMNETNSYDDEGTQLRPHIVWFGEYPYFVNESNKAFTECDIVIIIGTSLNITYTMDFFSRVGLNTKIYYIDPQPSQNLGLYFPELNVDYIKLDAIEGLKKIKELL